MAWIAFENLADIMPLTSTTAFAATLPLTNLQDRRLAKVARRSTPGTSLVTRIDNQNPYGGTPSAPHVRLVALLNLNWQRRPFYDDFFMTAQCTWKASNVAFGNTDVGTATPFLQDRSNVDFPTNIIVPLRNPGVTPYIARFWEMTWSWTVDPVIGAGAAQAGRLWVGNYWDLTDSLGQNGIDATWSIDHIDTSVVRRSRSQSVYVDENPRKRVLKVTVAGVSGARMFGSDTAPNANDYRSLQDIIVSAGQSREVIFCPRAMSASLTVEDMQFYNRTVIYGTMVGSHTISKQAGDNYSISFQIEEAR